MTAHGLLHDPAHVSRCSAEDILELCLRAGYPEEAAQKAAAAHGFRRVQEGLTA